MTLHPTRRIQILLNKHSISHCSPLQLMLNHSKQQRFADLQVSTQILENFARLNCLSKYWWICSFFSLLSASSIKLPEYSAAMKFFATYTAYYQNHTWTHQISTVHYVITPCYCTPISAIHFHSLRINFNGKGTWLNRWQINQHF